MNLRLPERLWPLADLAPGEKRAMNLVGLGCLALTVTFLVAIGLTALVAVRVTLAVTS